MFSRLIFFLLTLSAFADGSDGVAITSGNESFISQSGVSQVLRDEGGVLTLAQVTQSTAWRDIKERKDTRPGFDQSAFWSKALFTSTARTNRTWLISLGSTRWEEIDWYVLREGGEVEHYMAGNARSGRAGVMPGPQPNIILSLAPSEQVELYLRCRSRARGSFDIKISNINNPQGVIINNIYLFSFGALAIVSFLGPLITFRGRQEGGVAYSISVVALGSYLGGMSGFAKSFDLPFTHFFTMEGGSFFVILSYLSALFYLRPLFEIDKTNQWPKLFWRVYLIISSVALPCSLISHYSSFVYFIHIHGGIFMLFSLSSTVWAWKRGMKFAKYYLLVWLLLWVPAFYDTFSKLGVIPLYISQDHFLALGTVAYQIGIFLILALQTRAKVREYEADQQRLLEKEKNLNIELDRQVKARTAELHKATDEAIKANKFKGLFLANMGHEIRTPLSALIGLSQYMVRKGESFDLPSDFQRMLGQVHSGGSHLNLMLTNLMDVGTASYGKIPLLMAPVNLTSWSQSVNDILEPLALTRDLTLEWNEDLDSSPSILSDQVRLSQVLINLVHNALKFSPEQGVVEVFITKGEVELTLEVLDQGCGLPDNPETLFNLYKRHAAILSDAEHGAGLGLYIVKTTLDRLGGTIIASNRPTGGASFLVTIPEYKNNNSHEDLDH